MGGRVSRTQFTFSYTDEPHATRRKLILSKYPQVKKLMTVDKMFKWHVTAIVTAQFISFYLLRNVTHFWTLFVLAYFFGGVANHSLMLAIHELSHNLGFGPGRPLANKLFAMFANLPIGAPIAISFKKYHLDHHRYQGDELLDTDVPTFAEAILFRHIPTKMLWCIMQPFFYTLRPFFVNPKRVEKMEMLNILIQLTFDILIYYTLGIHIIFYMIGGSALAMGLHPVAGHFISEHFLIFDNKTENSKDSFINDCKPIKENDHLSCSDTKPNLINRSDINGNYMSDNNNNLEESINSSKSCDKITDTLTQDGQFIVPETCSYYGPLNWVTFNVGYHVEHHDFPSIPGSRLHELHKIAPEFYLTLNYHTSWVKVIWQYITAEHVGPSARVRRPHDSKRFAKLMS